MAKNYMLLKGALEPKQETLEEAVKRVFKKYSNNTSLAEGDYDYMMDKENFKEASLEILKWQTERMYSEEDLISFAEFVTTYTDKNRNVHGQMLHAKSKYDGAERTVDLFEIWFEQFKNK